MENINDSGVCVINVNDEVIKLRFGMPANRMIAERFVHNPNFLQPDHINEQDVAFLLYAGYTNECMSNDMPVLKPFSVFFSYVEWGLYDEVTNKQITDVSECYAASRFTKKMVEKINVVTEDIKKKNQTGTSLSPSATESLPSQESNTTA